jgi:hypothetical protein
MASFQAFGIFLLLVFTASLCHALQEEPDVTKCVKKGGGHTVCSNVENKGCIVTFKTRIDENNHTQIKPHNEAVTKQGCTLIDRGGPDCEFNSSTAGEPIVRCYCQWNSCNVKAIIQDYLDEFNGAGQITATFALISLGLVMAGMAL